MESIYLDHAATRPRFSIGKGNTLTEIERVAVKVARLVSTMRK